MMYEEIDSSMWWSDVMGPRRLADATGEALRQGNSIALRIGDFFPWRRCFRENVLEAAELAESHVIDCADHLNKGATIRNAVELILDKLFPAVNGMDSIERADYKCRPSGATPEDWLRDSRYLRGKLVWIKGVPTDMIPIMTQLLEHFPGKPKQGQIVVEFQSDTDIPTFGRNVRTFSYDDYVHVTDVQVFARFLLQQCGVPHHMRDYAVYLLTSLCDTDIELVQALAMSMDFTRDDPIARLREIKDRFDESHGSFERPRIEAHPFQLLDEQDMRPLVRRVWRAQLQVAFPKIEFERIRVIEEHKTAIEEALQTQYWNGSPETPEDEGETGFIRQFEREVVDPYDLELGTIMHMVKLKRADDHRKPLLQLPGEDIRLLSFFVDMRNSKLAHIYENENCTPEEMSKILRIEPQWSD